VAGKAVALAEAATTEYQEYARTVIANAQALTSGLESHGMRAVSGGTDTHLALIDLQPLGVTGKEAEARSGLAGITLNKNAIPYDPQPPMTASGIRVGSPSITTQGMTTEEMPEVARLIATAVTADETTEDGKRTLADVRDEVGTLVARFPAYPRS
jgi:glycine hydroxymethyltransferase